MPSLDPLWYALRHDDPGYWSDLQLRAKSPGQFSSFGGLVYSLPVCLAMLAARAVWNAAFARLTRAKRKEDSRWVRRRCVGRARRGVLGRADLRCREMLAQARVGCKRPPRAARSSALSRAAAHKRSLFRASELCLCHPPGVRAVGVVLARPGQQPPPPPPPRAAPVTHNQRAARSAPRCSSGSRRRAGSALAAW